MKKILATAALALSTLMAGTAPTRGYNINLSTNVKAGSLELKAGRYRLVLQGNTATFTEAGKSKGVTTPVKLQEGDKKFEDTRIITSKDGATDKIDEIDLGGSKTKLTF
jgi:hypothetical protein